MTVHIKMGLELGKQKKITITNLKAVLQGVITGVGRACLAPSFATRQRWFGTSAGTVVASMTKISNLWTDVPQSMWNTAMIRKDLRMFIRTPCVRV